MEKTFEKDGDSLKVITTKSEVVENSFTYDYLKKQKEAIKAQKDRDNAQRDLELAEVDQLIAEAKKHKLDKVEVKAEELIIE